MPRKTKQKRVELIPPEIISSKIFLIRGKRVMLDRENDWKNPFGDGKAGEKIVEILEEKI